MFNSQFVFLSLTLYFIFSFTHCCSQNSLRKKRGFAENTSNQIARMNVEKKIRQMSKKKNFVVGWLLFMWMCKNSEIIIVTAEGLLLLIEWTISGFNFEMFYFKGRTQFLVARIFLLNCIFTILICSVWGEITKIFFNIPVSQDLFFWSNPKGFAIHRLKNLLNYHFLFFVLFV